MFEGKWLKINPSEGAIHSLSLSLSWRKQGGWWKEATTEIGFRSSSEPWLFNRRASIGFDFNIIFKYIILNETKHAGPYKGPYSCKAKNSRTSPDQQSSRRGESPWPGHPQNVKPYETTNDQNPMKKETNIWNHQDKPKRTQKGQFTYNRPNRPTNPKKP